MIHSSNFDNFLSVNRIFDKDTKQGDVVLKYVIVILNKGNDKNYIKKVKAQFQVK